MFRYALLSLAWAAIAGSAAAQVGLGQPGYAPGRGAQAREQAEKARDARVDREMDRAKREAERDERQKEIDARIAAAEAEVKAIEAAASTESRPLTPAETVRVAAIKYRVEQTRKQREAYLASVDTARERARAQSEAAALQRQRARAAQRRLADPPRRAIEGR